MQSQIAAQVEHTYEEKLKAAYALNMCTVSIAQIVDYNDAYILEQEYDAILNNLNLKEMPKDEALLRIISEILNTITFFRIQECKKEKIEKQYKQKLKNAIWSAVPNLSVVVSGNPVAIAMSLATQIGSGYMNYRREKANAAHDKNDSEIELQLTAIEQLNALRRELFTTAWRISDEYDFDDEWRLTEKQIKQYNDVLRDTDEYRKYARMEAIADKFIAYPPFWYFYGHTANYIAEMARNDIRGNHLETEERRAAYYQALALAKMYTELAKTHYEHYYSLCRKNILREDQLTATFALEYVDILYKAKDRDIPKIRELLSLAEKMAPNSLDILQLCAISYLKIGSSDDAARLLKTLIYEGFNATSNAKLLSRLYVSKYIATGDSLASSNYQILARQIDPLYLYPMPDNHLEKGNELRLTSDFMAKQKAILKKAYRNSMDAYAKKQIVEFNAVLPAARNNLDDYGAYFAYTDSAKKRRKCDARNALESGRSAEIYITALKERGFRYGYIGILNQTISGLEMLSCFRNHKAHDTLIKLIEAKIRNARSRLKEIQANIDEGRFTFGDYCTLVDDYSYQYFTEDFFDALKRKVSDKIDSIRDLDELDTYDFELAQFCEKNGLPAPEEYLHVFRAGDLSDGSVVDSVFFEGELIGVEDGSRGCGDDTTGAMFQLIKENIAGLVRNPENIALYLRGDGEFDTYFKNENLRILSGSIFLRKQKTLAIVDDRTKKDFDLILCSDGVALVSKNVIRDIVDYRAIAYSANGKQRELLLGYPDVYTNKNIDIVALKSIVDKLGSFLHNANLD